MFGVSNYDEDVKKFQAKAWAELQIILAKPEPKPDPLLAQRSFFLSKLIDVRLGKGLSQNELAKLSGLSQPVIARVESGRGNPSLRTLLTIAKTLDVNLMLD